MEPRHGIDTSHYQHPGGKPIDWHAVAGAGVTWAAIKLTEGSSYVDPWAERDLAGAKAAGLETVLYHFARPSQNDPVAEKRHFLANVWKIGGADAAALDVEDGRQMGWSQLGRWVQSFIDARACQYVYWSRDYARHLVPLVRLGTVRQWVAAPGAKAAPPHAAIWQRGQGDVPGVPAPVDIDAVLYTR